ncbi:MAG TPA: ectonucleotide pyrophosphatase/phosphodiesterase [Bryobacteraceae bacterium]|nr:ectonucleotide pyrophosphatase/phosphodiesterase [Bryobacteraceae bacterium]
MLRRRFVSTLALAAASPLAGQARKSRQVILISIDGFPAYALNDPGLPLPTIRRLAREGAAADSMQTVNPSVTWPNHTSMVTGVTPARHGLLYNGMPVRQGEGKPLKVEPWVAKENLVLAPTVYDLAHEAGLTTAEIDWVAIHQAKTITWSFAERPLPTDAVPREMIAAGLVTEAEIRDFAKADIVLRDEIWTQAAVHILQKHKPNLMLFHLLATDSSQHRYGARSLGGRTALALADARVKQIVDTVGDRATIIIVSDHGFKTYDKVIQANAFLAVKGFQEDVWVIPEGGSAMVYITRSAKKAELAPKLRSELAGIAGVKAVIEPSGFEQHGFPPPNDRMADMVLLAEDGYSFGGAVKGETVTNVPAGSTPGAHGYVNTDPDMNAVFVAWGAGIKGGTRLGSVRNLDVAPTIARLLGLDMKNMQGRVLTEALQ